jgi:hypothetical protein
MLPFYSVRDVPGLYPVNNKTPSPLGFAQVLILNIVQVICFDTLLQVFILNDLHLRQNGVDFVGLRVGQIGVMARFKFDSHST